MRRYIAGIFSVALLTASPAFAVMEDYPSVKLQGLDKSVGRTVTFEARVGSTIQYGPLFIKIHACRKAPPIEKPESAAFLQIWEVPPGEEKSEWAFSGWMFASSPALSAMDHPVYDVWVLDCLGREEPNDEAAEAETSETVDDANLPAPDAAADTQTPPVDGEAVPADAEAVPEDMEAEPEPAPQPVVNPDTAYPSVPQPAPQADEVDSLYNQQPAQPQLPVPAPAPSANDPGFTAYDIMKQGGANAAPAPTPTPTEPKY